MSVQSNTKKREVGDENSNAANLKKLYVNICSPATAVGSSSSEGSSGDSGSDGSSDDDDSTSDDTSEEETPGGEDPLMLKPAPPRTRPPVAPVIAPASRNRSGRPHSSNAVRFRPQPLSMVAARFFSLKREALAPAQQVKNEAIKKEAEEIEMDRPSPSSSPDFDWPLQTFKAESDMKPATEAKPVKKEVLVIASDAAIKMEMDAGTQGFRCNRPDCTYTAATRREVNVHKREDHKHSRDFVCDQCPYRAHTASDLRKHYRNHSGENPYVCPYEGCDWKGKQSNNLDYHKRKFHPTGEPLKCDYNACEFTTRLPALLKIHFIKKHSGEKAIACKLCPYRCHLSNELRKHMLSHSSLTPFACDFPGCGYACKISSNLRKHKRMHSEEKPYACEQCVFRSNFISSLKAHKRTHTDEKPYCCSQCGYRCNSASNLKKHTKQRHPGAAYTLVIKRDGEQIEPNVKQESQRSSAQGQPANLLPAPQPPILKGASYQNQTLANGSAHS